MTHVKWVESVFEPLLMTLYSCDHMKCKYVECKVQRIGLVVPPHVCTVIVCTSEYFGKPLGVPHVSHSYEPVAKALVSPLYTNCAY